MHGHLNVKSEVIFWFHLIITERGLHLILQCHEHEVYSVLLYVVLLWKGSYDMSDPSYDIWSRGMPICNPLSTCALPKLWLYLYLMLSWTNGSYMVSCGIYLTKECILFIKVQWNLVFSDDMRRGGVVLDEVQYSQYIVFLWQCSGIQGSQKNAALAYCWNLVNISEQHIQ